ncbi:MAG: MBL fold metallo-hydrolase [Deltaproteobacteria bacterium]|nr:MBL fold metallo-hydrolase [Deltaproteobacteria bacterium]
MKRLSIAVLVVLVIAVTLAWLNRAEIGLRLVDRLVARNLASNLLDELPDGLHVALCGSGSPLPDPGRAEPCVAIAAGSRVYVVDAGSGGTRNLQLMRIPVGRIDAILLTHFHSDHIDGLGELLMQRWVNGTHDSPTPVYGPPGVERVVAGFDQAYALDAVYRVAHHGVETVPPSGAGGTAREFAAPADGAPTVVLERDGLTITAFRVNHFPIVPAVGYRFDYAGRSVVVSGDTVQSAELTRMAKGADVLVHEALSRQLVRRINAAAQAAGRANLVKITADILDYHTSPTEAAQVASDAGVGHLLYYHIVPPLPIEPLEVVFLEGVDEVWDGPVTIGTDGKMLSLPAGSDDIVERDLL